MQQSSIVVAEEVEYMLLLVLARFTIICLRKRPLVDLLYCVISVYVLCLFLMVLLVGLPSLIIAFPCHTHLRFRGHINCHYPGSELVKFFFMCIYITLQYFNAKKWKCSVFNSGVTNNYWSIIMSHYCSC